MTRPRRNALILILLCGGISILWGFSIGQSLNGWVDFRSVYYGTRCLLQHHNPYNAKELDLIYKAEGGVQAPESAAVRQAVTLNINTPGTLITVIPFALLPWGPAHLLWIALLAGGFLLAACLTWSLAEGYSRGISLFLICILLANSESIFLTGNTAGIVISLCVIAVWCFIEDRFVGAGILCLAVSLAIKPHDAGLVWLYFLLSGSLYRRRALWTLLVTAVMGLFAVIWLFHVAPHWLTDWKLNLAESGAVGGIGGINGPGLNSFTGRSFAMPIDLQAAISVFWKDPRIYNLTSYLACGTLLLVWAIRTLRRTFTKEDGWIALAAVVPLTMLVTYHRPWDARLLLLTIPACAMLWARGGRLRWIAFLVTSLAVVTTADIPLAILNIFASKLQITTSAIWGKVLALVLMRPASLALLVMCVFYLWVYVRRSSDSVMETYAGDHNRT